MSRASHDAGYHRGLALGESYLQEAKTAANNIRSAYETRQRMLNDHVRIHSDSYGNYDSPESEDKGDKLVGEIAGLKEIWRKYGLGPWTDKK